MFETIGVEAALTLLANVSLKATLLAALVWLGLKLFRVDSVTVRHRVWSLVSCSIFLLPCIILMAPELAIPIEWMADSAPEGVSATDASSVAKSPVVENAGTAGS